MISKDISIEIKLKKQHDIIIFKNYKNKYKNNNNYIKKILFRNNINHRNKFQI